MKQAINTTLTFSNTADLMKRLGLDPPLHPLITLVDYDQVQPSLRDAGSWFLLDFYKISFKKTFSGSVKYGPGNYDFKDGGLAFLAPHQLVEMSASPEDYQGQALFVHPDLWQNHSLAQTIYRYGFFSYSVTEALFLSEKEKGIIASLFQAIAAELENNIDKFSQDVLLSQIEMLLIYSNRFYNRQFLTRNTVHHDLIDRMNLFLTDRFNTGTSLVNGLPSPQDVADQLKVSQRYLSDMLKSLTGKTTQQHIHLRLIEKAKALLSQNLLSTAEIAYELGFEHAQSFNKLFKQKTNLSPAAFRQSDHVVPK
jgi:AraC-like DNA-binding protein